MAIIRISKEFNFDMAHALLGYDGLCRNIHGHSYTLTVTIKGEPVQDSSSPKNGMLIDFKDLKTIIRQAIIDEFDHALVINEKTADSLKNELLSNYDKIVTTPYQPTTENMLFDLSARVRGLLPSHVSLVGLRLRETGTSYAEWLAEDNP